MPLELSRDKKHEDEILLKRIFGDPLPDCFSKPTLSCGCCSVCGCVCEWLRTELSEGEEID